jgi:hypothetical protein
MLLLYFLERNFWFFLWIHLLNLLHQVSNLILELCIYLSIRLQLVLQLLDFIFIADFFFCKLSIQLRKLAIKLLLLIFDILSMWTLQFLQVLLILFLFAS